MRELFVRRLQAMLGRETAQHEANLRRVLTIIGEPDVEREEMPDDELAATIRKKHAEIAEYTVLVRLAEALELDDEAVRLLRLNMEQDAYALERGEAELVRLLAEATAGR
ncbi:MAG: hypothetical protein ACRDNM_04760 [Gaiellaceae bacterium]